MSQANHMSNWGTFVFRNEPPFSNNFSIVFVHFLPHVTRYDLLDILLTYFLKNENSERYLSFGESGIYALELFRLIICIRSIK